MSHYYLREKKLVHMLRREISKKKTNEGEAISLRMLINIEMQQYKRDRAHYCPQDLLKRDYSLSV